MGIFNASNNRGRGSGDRKGRRVRLKALRAATKRKRVPHLFSGVDKFPTSTTTVRNYHGNGGAFVGVTLGEVPVGTQITFTVGAGGTTSTTGGNTGGASFFTYDSVSLTAGGGFGGHFQTTAYTFGAGGRRPAEVGLAEGATSGTTQGVIGMNLINGNASTNSLTVGGLFNNGLGTGGSGDNGLTAPAGTAYSRGGQAPDDHGLPGLVVIF